MVSVKQIIFKYQNPILLYLLTVKNTILPNSYAHKYNNANVYNFQCFVAVNTQLCVKGLSFRTVIIKLHLSPHFRISIIGFIIIWWTKLYKLIILGHNWPSSFHCKVLAEQKCALEYAQVTHPWSLKHAYTHSHAYACALTHKFSCLLCMIFFLRYSCFLISCFFVCLFCLLLWTFYFCSSC